MIKKISGYTAVAIAVVGLMTWGILHATFASVEANSAQAPVAQTLDVTDVSSTSVILHGTYNNNNGEGGRVWFEYGINAGSMQRVNEHLVNASGLVNENYSLTNLPFNTNYSYRFVAENGDGLSQGVVKTFKTLPSGDATCQPNTKRDLTYQINYRTSGWMVASSTITNNSTNCTYKVGMASYKVYADNQGSTQTIITSESKTVAPGQTVELNVTLASCATQVDVFEGDVLTPPTYTQDRLFAGPVVNLTSGGYCSNVTVQPATLTIIKTVTNDNGGTKQVSDFALFQNGVQVTSGQSKTYTFARSTDTYDVTATETNLPGYTAGAWGGDCAADGKVTLRPGENKTCRINNNDNAPVASCPNTSGTLTLSETKTAISQGKITVSLNIDTSANKANATVVNNTECNVPVSLSTYKMFDRTLDTQEFFDADPINSPYQYVVAPHTTKNMVANIASCMAQADVWYGPFERTLHNGATPTTPSPYPNALVAKIARSTGTTYYDAAGNFCQRPPQSATLKIVKTVINDNGGVKQVSDFKLFQNGVEVTSGQTKTYTFAQASDTYDVTVNENNLSGYTAGNWGTDCSADGKVTLRPGDAKTCTITNNDVPPSTSNFAIACAAYPTSQFIGNPVKFTATATGGNGSYTYAWSGDENLSGNTAEITKIYNSIGTKSSTVSVTSNGETRTAQCSVVIVQPVSCGNCTPPPSVTVTSTQNPGQVAGVFLSQVPYTGVGSNLKIAFFMLALFSWSAWISYLIIKRKAKKSGVSVSEIFTGPVSNGPTLAFAGTPSASPVRTIPVMENMPRVDIKAIPHESKPVEPKSFVKSPFIEHMQPVAPIQPKVEEAPAPKVEAQVAPVAPKVPTDDTYEKIFNRVNEAAVASKFQPAMTAVKSNPDLMPQVAKPQAQIAIPSSTSDVLETLEMKARELQTLVSADGLELIAKAAQNNKHNAVLILNHLVELYKGSEHEVDGDWMVLNAEKINKILFSTYITMTPVFIQWLALGDEKKTMAFVRMLQMQGQTMKDFVMNIVIELDKAFRFRVENMGDADATILDATTQWSNQELESVIHTLVTAVDQTYSSSYASVKIALVKVLDMAKSKVYS